MSTPKELNPNYWPLKETVEIEIADAAKKDAEIERLKGELAESVRLLSEAPSNWNGTHRTGCGALTRRGGAGVCNCSRDAWEQAILAFLQKHTPPLNCGSAAAGDSPSHSGGGESLLGALQELLRNVRAGLLGVSEISTVLGTLIGDYQTGKSALREVPTTGDDHSTGEISRQGPEGSTPSLPATLCAICGKPEDVHIGVVKSCNKGWGVGPVFQSQEQKHEKGAGV